MKVKSESEAAQSCPTLHDPMDCSLPGSSIHGILQARIVEWVAISFSRGSSQPRDQTRVSRIAGRCFTTCATRVVCNHEPQLKPVVCWLYSCITMWALLCCVSSVSSTTYKFHKDWAQIMFSLSSIQHRRYLTHWKLSVISFEQIHRWKKKSNCLVMHPDLVHMLAINKLALSSHQVCILTSMYTERHFVTWKD